MTLKFLDEVMNSFLCWSKFKAVVYTRDKTKSSLYGFEKFQNTVGIPDQLEGAIVDAGQLAVSEVFLERFAEQFRGGKEGGLATVKWLFVFRASESFIILEDNIDGL